MFMSFMKSAYRFYQLGKENTYIGDSTSSRILPIPKTFIKVGRELQALKCPSALSTQVSKCPSAHVPFECPRASRTPVHKCQVPWVAECPSVLRVPKCPLSTLGVTLESPLGDKLRSECSSSKTEMDSLLVLYSF